MHPIVTRLIINRMASYNEAMYGLSLADLISMNILLDEMES